MSKITKRPLTREDAANLLKMAQEQLQDTDGCPICFVAMRVNLNGQTELFTPTISPKSIPLDLTIDIVRAYLSFLESGQACPFEDSPDKAQLVEIQFGQKPRKHTVN